VPTAYVPHGYAFGYAGDGLAGGIHYLLVERALRAFTGALVCVSPDEEATARRHRLAPLDRTHLVPNAVDPEEFRDLPNRDLVRDRLGLPRDARVALMVARLAPPKDPLTFVRAGALLPLGPPLPRLLLVGDGPLMEPCLDLALESGLGDTLVCPGVIPDMRALLAAADALVLSTEYEGLPYVLLEGLAAGLPVVASDVPGCRALLGGGRGRLVPPGDATALARAIEEALDEGLGPSRLPPGYDLDSWIVRIEGILRSLA
jgi:glycosyltransferase involved in cell wall biosynthesis